MCAMWFLYCHSYLSSVFDHTTPDWLKVILAALCAALLPIYACWGRRNQSQSKGQRERERNDLALGAGTAL